jgi:hypothetical protein
MTLTMYVIHFPHLPTIFHYSTTTSHNSITPSVLPLATFHDYLAHYLTTTHEHLLILFLQITAGALLGLCIAKFFYSCNFHNLSSNLSHLPLSRNTKRPAPYSELPHERRPVRLDDDRSDADEEDEERADAY